jgi:hypothetical protein
MKDELVSSTPIWEIRDNMLNSVCFVQFQRYLEKECGCSCTALDDGSVLISFPEGTIEEEYAGQSMTWKRETTIHLPNGVRLTKRVYPPTMEGGKLLVALLLPKEHLKNVNGGKNRRAIQNDASGTAEEGRQK